MRKHHPMLVCCIDTLLIHDTSTWSSQILHTTFPRPMHVIREREKGVTRTRSLIQLLPPLLPLFIAQWFGYSFKKTFPVRFLGPLKNLAANVEIDGVRLFRTFNALFERKRKDLLVVPEPPEIGFGSCKTGAVDTRLLSGPDTDNRSTVCVGNTVRLGVLEGERGNNQVPRGISWELQPLLARKWRF